VKNQERKSNNTALDDAGDDSNRPIDTRPLRCTNDALIDPLLERLKKVHGNRN